jgi:hypothetical protein
MTSTTYLKTMQTSYLKTMQTSYFLIVFGFDQKIDPQAEFLKFQFSVNLCVECSKMFNFDCFCCK